MQQTRTLNRAVRAQIMRCHEEGWQPVNIASICHVPQAVVLDVLREKGIEV